MVVRVMAIAVIAERKQNVTLHYYQRPVPNVIRRLTSSIHFCNARLVCVCVCASEHYISIVLRHDNQTVDNLATCMAPSCKSLSLIIWKNR